MLYPTLPEENSTRETIEYFKGYNHNLRIGRNEFFDMRNMTSDYYPILSPRGKRGTFCIPANAQSLIAKDKLCYVDGSSFVIGSDVIDMGLSSEPEDCPKQLVSMGAYVIIMPDRMYINTLDTADRGRIDAGCQTTGDVQFALCSITGELYENPTVSDSAPENPENQAIWIDTSASPHALKKYAEASGQWVTVASTYIRIGAAGIGKHFAQYDGVTVSGIVKENLEMLNGTMVVWERGDDFLVVTGILDAATTQTAAEGSITVRREMPAMDFIVESKNRLWGCRYGIANNGEMVNEIYASKLGDFRNWNCFMGLSTDSYAASCGTDGPFTGAITYPDSPLFLKENCMHKVYGTYPANYQIQDVACRGVQRGSHGSLAIVNEVLYYKSRTAVCAYDGSLPTEVSAAFGTELYSDAVAGAHGNKYYISMKDSNGVWQLMVYDAAKGMWHKEDNLHVSSFCSCGGEFYAIDADSGAILALLGSGTKEEKLNWMVQTGEVGIASPDMKYISKLTVRMSLDVGTEVRFYARYDFCEEWEPLFSLRSTNLRSVSIPIRPKRCDFMKIRIEGDGGAKIYSITKTIEGGSDIS